MSSLIVAAGAVTSDATINVGGGDFEIIIGGSGTNSFVNAGQINAEGTATNGAVLYLGPTPGVSGASLTASYGDINLNDTFFWAAAANASASANGDVTLQDASEALVTANLQHTNFAFSATGANMLAIAQRCHRPDAEHHGVDSGCDARVPQL
jgi:hypothetical protein